MTASLIGIGILLVFSAFFSGTETALTAASRARIHHLEEKGNRRARIVSRLMMRRERLIGSMLVGNNIVNILASSLATSLLITLVGDDAAVAMATVIMTVLVIIFCEVLPKTYAIRQPDRTALAVAPWAAVVVFVLSPIAIAVQAIVSGILRLLGQKVKPSSPEAAEEELRGTISLHAKSGTVVQHEREMLHSILDLDRLTVGEIMTHRRRMLMLDADMPPRELIEKVMTSSYTRIPVWRGEPDNIIGVLHAKDVLRALGAANGKPDAVKIEPIMAKPWFVPETTNLFEQLNAFREKHAHFALVVDEYGALMGLITLEDILEEIVGDITDEHDTASRMIAPRPDGSYLVQGTATIRDVNRRLGWSLSGEEATTVAGLVLHHAQTIPNVGDSCEVDGFTFEVVHRLGTQLTQIKIIPPREVAAREG
jgi:Mg2+/Co2+ transporter CorB